MIIDTHCHLIDDAFVNEVETVISNALDADVLRMVLACCCQEEFEPITSLCRRYPENLYPTIGIHPENLEEDVQRQFSALFNEQATQHPIVAVGEIGIDLHWDQSRLADQLWLLEAQIRWALEHDLPILLHIRDAMPEFLRFCHDTLYNITNSQREKLRGILHCYSGTAQEAFEALQYGDFLFGIGGTLTYKKSSVPEVAKAIGIDRIVLETDAPYLAPVPKRGRRNEPAYTAITCQALAEILGISQEEAAVKTTQNAIQLFRF